MPTTTTKPLVPGDTSVARERCRPGRRLRRWRPLWAVVGALAALGAVGASPAVAASHYQFSAVAVGNTHACAIRSTDGSIVCWGDDYYGQMNAPSGSFSAISAGSNHTCAIRSSDRSIVCWGRDQAGQTNAPSGSFSAVSAGGDHTCAIKSSDSSIVCWGQDDYDQSNPATGSFSAVSSGDYKTCAIRSSDGSLVCWGIFKQGDYLPTGSFSAISTGEDQVCAIKSSDGSIVCSNFDGPTNAPSGSFSALSAAVGHVCAIKSSDSSIVCWGLDDFGQSNPATGSFSAVSSGLFDTCAIRATDSSVVCWGDDAFGQTNVPQPNTTTTTVSAPTSDILGTAIPASSIAANLSGATSGAGGTLTLKVFGPQPSAPTDCSSGGHVLGTDTVSGNGTYNSPGGFKPPSVGTYWFYASYSGDANDKASNSGCAAGMTSMLVNPDDDLALSTPPDITVNATAPSGAVVSYTTPTATDENNPATAQVSCSPASGSTFAIGTTTVTCTATDADDTNSPVTRTFNVTVKGAAGQLTDLYSEVQGIGPGTSLSDKVAQAQSYLTANDLSDTCSTLSAFADEVQAQAGKSIAVGQANQLIVDAQRIRAVLGCS